MCFSYIPKNVFFFLCTATKIYVLSFSCKVQTEAGTGVLSGGTMLLQCPCGLECPDLKSKLPRYLALLSFQGFSVAFAFRKSHLKLTSPCAIKQKLFREKARHEQAPDLRE